VWVRAARLIRALGASAHFAIQPLFTGVKLMANPEHLRILKQGVKRWNQWREMNFNTLPDLSNIDLKEIHLARANLELVDFRGANLSHANFAVASLAGADLSNSNLNGASLVLTNLSLANLSKATLRGAFFGSTILGGTNLTDAKGLYSCIHLSPSTIDHRTLTKSGRLSLNFMRGCGLPDTLIEYIPSLLNNPIQFYSCFISYSSKNRIFVDRLYADLQNKGVRCWLASENLKIGEKLRIGIDESIRVHDKLLLVLSKHSVASDWVEQEVETALDRERKEKRIVLFPIRLDDVVMKIDTGWPALIKNTRNIGDFLKWRSPQAYQKSLDRLLRDLKAGVVK
jgi:uncharacterized protein YjbI with pentapeptide repeats